MQTEPNRTEPNGPEAWVGCLACYNDGRLVGAWVDALEAADYVPNGHTVRCISCGITEPDADEDCPNRTDREEGATFGRQHYVGIVFDADGSAHEEQWVMDYQGFEGFLTSECSPVEAQRIAEALEAIPDYIPRGAVAAWLANTGDRLTDWADIEDDFGDSYSGEWSTEVEYAQDLAESIGAVDDSATCWPNDCIDWERAARELFMDYWTAEAPGGVYVFRQ
jgi:antirestriction protein